VSGDLPKFSLIQVELTSRCQLACRTCLRGSHCHAWQTRDLDTTLIHSLVRELPETTTLHLQGWGEPLLFPLLYQVIAQVKEQGCRVSLTSSGTPMDREQAARLVAAGLDALTFSMAGTDAATQDALRGTGSFRALEQALDHINACRKGQGTCLPVLAVSYLLTPQTIRQLPGAVSWCARRNISLLAGVHLTHAVNGLQRSLQCCSSSGVKCRQARTYLRRAGVLAVFHRLQLHMPAMAPEEMPVCAKNPLDSFFVAADGSVAPCVFLCPPYSSSESPLSGLVFGNLHNASLATIWNRPQYKQFRKIFARRLALYNQTMARVGFDLDAMERLEQARKLISQYFADNPLPDPCQSCLKMQGF